ncbi:hypothetical protein BGZ99_001413 [Dissophora globulifera]|uniref:Peptidase S53 domain-containing protein n=1 Tax=Dissophora globulifera TaxID=979702 RepID=A0A9P6UJ75_9FUNG|nr:hypothetical protein BGZ99_001413 [Dissophora globulifera]
MARSTFAFVFIAMIVSFVLALPQIPPVPTPPAPGLPDFSQFIPVVNLDRVPDGFTDLGEAPMNTAVAVTIGLQLQNLDQLTAKLFDISDPSNPNYGKFMSADDLFALVAPPKELVDLALIWLKTFGIIASYSNGYLTFDVNVGVLGTLFQAKFRLYRFDVTGEEIIRTMEYGFPTPLDPLFETVFSIADFDTLIPHATYSPDMRTSKFTRRQMPESCSNTVTPICLQGLYNIPKDPATQRQQLAVPGFINEYANRQDLAAFMQSFRPYINPAPTFAEQLVDNGRNPQDLASAGIEANLDIQYTVGIAPGVPTTFYSSGHSNLNGFVNLARNWLNMAQPPSVVSISYGFNENQPFVTAVGATQGIPEVGAEFSAGGFSDHFSRPPYQNNAVNAYLGSIGAQYSGRFNPAGRAYPDVSAQGKNISILKGGQPIQVDGTSASAPIFASVIALINDRLISKGKPVLGFLNPGIYSNPGIWNDITTGNNPSCETNGFSAQSGWDPVTGMGTPSFQRFAAAVGA